MPWLVARRGTSAGKENSRGERSGGVGGTATWRVPSTPSRPHHLPAAGQGRLRNARSGRRTPRNSVLMAADTVGLPREDGRGKADSSSSFGDDAQKSQGLDPYCAK